MQSYKSISLLLLLTTVFSACSGASVPPSSSTGALTANSALGPAQRPFDRQMLMVNGLQSLNEFIRADVRNRVDEEAVGDSNPGYDSPDYAPESTEPAGQNDVQNETKSQQSEEPDQPQNGIDEDTASYGASDSGKFLWAKKSFGYAVKANPAAGGVIVLYADENFYDINAMMSFIEAGRDRIIQESEIPSDRIQVVFGGYRGAPQVEYWIVNHGAAMPEFKTEDRSKADDLED